MSNFHTPVLLKEVIENLNIKKGEWYIDCNLGGGGHTQAIIDAGGKVVAVDLDRDAILESAKKFNLEINEKEGYLEAVSGNLIIVESNFSHIDEVVEKFKIEKVSGILFDLGVSSYQLETAEKGFSFMREGDLDMRFSKKQNIKASDFINNFSEKELARIFWEFGEEQNSKMLAKLIVENRPIETTKKLADLIEKKIPRGSSAIHPATKVFQSLRIAVNSEIDTLKESLPKAVNILSSGGRILVISFHSLEEKAVRDFFKEKHLKIVTRNPITPSLEEVNKNPRSRSAKLQVAEKN